MFYFILENGGVGTFQKYQRHKTNRNAIALLENLPNSNQRGLFNEIFFIFEIITVGLWFFIYLIKVYSFDKGNSSSQ